MAVFDIVILLVIGTFAVRGAMRGFVKEVLSLCAVVAGIVAIYFFHAPIAALLTSRLGSEYASALLAFVMIFGVFFVSTKLIASTISSQVHNAGLGMIDRVLGGGFGAIKGLLVAVVGYVVFTFVYDGLYGVLSPRPDWLRGTRSYPLLDAGAGAMSRWVAENSRDGGLVGVGEGDVKADGEAVPIKREAP